MRESTLSTYITLTLTPVLSSLILGQVCKPSAQEVQLSVVTLYLCLGEKMMSWGPISSDNFIKEVSEFLANNPYEEESQGEQHAVSWLVQTLRC